MHQSLLRPIRRHLSESRFSAVDNGIEPNPGLMLADLLR
jgi:hypothetical protein